MPNLEVIVGIGEDEKAKLKDAGISSSEALLDAAASKGGRAALAEKTGLSEKQILKWANNADLVRIKGVGRQYSELLEVAGVDTVPELAHRKAENLMNKLTQVNEEKKLVKKLPTLQQVEDWVSQASDLPRTLQY